MIALPFVLFSGVTKYSTQYQGWRTKAVSVLSDAHSRKEKFPGTERTSTKSLTNLLGRAGKKLEAERSYIKFEAPSIQENSVNFNVSNFVNPAK